MLCQPPHPDSLADLRRLRDEIKRRGDDGLAVLLSGVDMYVSMGREWELLEVMQKFVRDYVEILRNTPSAADLPPPRTPPARRPALPRLPHLPARSQPLVDCGFLSQAALRAPNELWKKLDARTQKNLAASLISSRVITPGPNNGLLFAATVE